MAAKKKKKKDDRPTTAKGINLVAKIVTETWQSGWQTTDADNDDGIDGYIHLRQHGYDTGEILLVQVKCGSEYRSDTDTRPEFVGINVQKLEERRQRWGRQLLPVVIIYVDPSASDKNPHAWWTDLKSNSSYTENRKNYILLPKKQRFGEHSKGEFRRLCGNAVGDNQLLTIQLPKDDASYFSLGGKLRIDAHEFYRSWAKSDASERMNPTLGEVTVSRVGWRHITRRSRKPAHKWQSWQLLGAAKQIIRQLGEYRRIGKVTKNTLDDGAVEIVDHLGLRANIQFPHRHESVVQVVLLRRQVVPKDNVINTESEIWFYSVYELRRDQLSKNVQLTRCSTIASPINSGTT